MVNLTIRLSGAKTGFGSGSGTALGTPPLPSGSTLANVSSADAATADGVQCGPHLALSDLPRACGVGAFAFVQSGATVFKGLGQKVRRSPGEKVHFCVRCNFPIAIYGRLDPCEHIFCWICAKKDASCYLCEDRVECIQKIELSEELFICGAAGCLRSFLSKPDFEWHVRDIHFELLPSRAATVSNLNDDLPTQLPFGHSGRPSSSPSQSRPLSPPLNGRQLNSATLGSQLNSPDTTPPPALDTLGKPHTLGPAREVLDQPSKRRKVEHQANVGGIWERDRERENQKQRDREPVLPREREFSQKDREPSQRERDRGWDRDRERDHRDRDRDRDRDRERDNIRERPRDRDRDRERSRDRDRDRDRERDRERDRDRDREIDQDRGREWDRSLHHRDRDRDRDREFWDQQYHHHQQQQHFTQHPQQGHVPLPPPPTVPPSQFHQTVGHQPDRFIQAPPTPQGVPPAHFPPQQPFPPFYPQQQQQQESRNPPRYDSPRHVAPLDPRSPDYQENNARGRHLQQEGERGRNVPPQQQQLDGYGLGMDRQGGGGMVPHFHPDYAGPPPRGMIVGPQAVPPGMNRFQEGGPMPHPPKRGGFGQARDAGLGHPEQAYGWVGPSNFGGAPGHGQFMNWQPPPH